MSRRLYRLNVGMALALFAIALTTVAVLYIRAADVSNAKDTMSNQSVGGAATHTISFNLSGGNVFSAGEVIIVDFPTGFTLSSAGDWEVADFAFRDAVLRTVDAVSAGPGTTTVTCADGLDNVGVAVDTTNATFRVIPCGSSFDDNPSGGEQLTFTIYGTTDATPDGWIANPSAAGSYVVRIEDAGGDCTGGDCAMFVSIVDSSTVTVSAEVTTPPVCGNGTVEPGEQCDDGNNTSGDGCSATCLFEGGGPPIDDTPPVIDFDCPPADVGVDYATFEWTTNESSDATVNCGLVGEPYTITETSSLYTTVHSVTVPGLEQNQTYDCQVCSTNTARLTSCSPDCRITTNDETPPDIISGPVCSATHSSLTIDWITDEPSDSELRWDLDGPVYDNTTSDPDLVTEHSMTLTGLLNGTTYHYQVRSTDARDNETFTGDQTCTTFGGPPPEITEGPAAVPIGCSANVSVTWSTNTSTDGLVEYGRSYGPPYDDLVADDITSTVHEVLLRDLEPGALYHYRVTSTDIEDRAVTSEDRTFTVADDQPPVISAVTAVPGTDTADVLWNTNELSDSRVDYGLTVSFGDVGTDSTPVMGHSVRLTGLQACTTYHYRVTSTDSCGDASRSGNMEFSTGVPEPPAIVDVSHDGVTENEVRISWTTTTPTTSRVDYGPNDAYGLIATDPALVTEHLIVLRGLTPGTEYHYRVYSVDPCGQDTFSGDDSFVTVADDVPPTCDTDLNAAPLDMGAALTWINPTDDDLVGVRLVRKTGDCPVGPSDGTVVYDGLGEEFTDSGLENGVQYCYATFPYDDADNFGCGVLATVIPVGPPDVTPPACASEATISADDGSLFLSWDNPTDADFTGARVVRRDDGRYPIGPNDGTVVYDGTENSWLDMGLTNGVTYHYGIFTHDGIPNYCIGEFVSGAPGIPVDTDPPSPITDLVVQPGDSLNLLTWTNPSDSDWTGTIVVRRDDGRYPAGPDDGTVVYDGTDSYLTDGGLTNGTTYHYAVFTYDGNGNYSVGVFGTGTPQGGLPQPVPQCTDTDGGRQYYVRGTVVTADITLIDACEDRDTLNEYYCTLDGYSTDVHDCGVGYKCSAGRCIPDTYEPPPNVCGNGICEHPDCFVDCGLMEYDLYIINPDLTERHLEPRWVRVTELEPGLDILSFEDKGDDNDFNDVEFKLDTRNCDDVRITLISHNAAWNHQVRIAVSYNGITRFDRLVWQDSLTALGSVFYLNAAGDPSICIGNETNLNCPEDCPVTTLLPVDDEYEGEPGRLGVDEVLFFATTGRIELPVDDGVVTTFPSMAVTVLIPHDAVDTSITRAFLNFGNSSYAMVRTDDGWEARILTPGGIGDYALTVIAEYDDMLTDTVQMTIRTVPFGQVYEKDKGEQKGVPDARVTLYRDNGEGDYGLWDGINYGQLNPTSTSPDGLYGFIVPPGVYQVVAEKDGYRTKESLPFRVNNGLVTRDLRLIALPKSLLEELTDALAEDDLGDVLEGIGDALGDELGYRTIALIEDWTEFSDNEFVEEATEQVVAPAVIAVAGVNVAIAGAATATAVPYMLYLYSLLTHPSLLLVARKRRKWGIVYNAISKVPVDLAIVRLIDDKTGKILRSRVTDKEGRYFFMVGKGEFRLSVAKPGFFHPSAYLKGQKEDQRYVDLYHGETIVVQDNASITANVPLDPVEKERPPRQVVWEGIGRRLQKSVSVLSIIAMGGAAIINPSPFVIGLFVANLVIYITFKRIAEGRRPKNWGVVYDNSTKRPLRNAVVRIFEAQYNKLLETKVTDLRGRYAFLVGDNVYYVTYEKPGFLKRQQGPLDMVREEKKGDVEQLVAEDVGLKPVKPKDPMQMLKRWALSLVAPFYGTGPAELTDVQFTDQIGPSAGGLIVGPGQKSAQEKAEAMKKKEEERKKKEEKDKKGDKAEGEAQIPWELRMLQQQEGGDKAEGDGDKSDQGDQGGTDGTSAGGETSGESSQTDKPASGEEGDGDDEPYEDEELKRLRYE
ncbi:fibronectin type III domain-containing protein [Patescibacteria group bacterium]